MLYFFTSFSQYIVYAFSIKKYVAKICFVHDVWDIGKNFKDRVGIHGQIGLWRTLFDMIYITAFRVIKKNKCFQDADWRARWTWREWGGGYDQHTVSIPNAMSLNIQESEDSIYSNVLQVKQRVIQDNSALAPWFQVWSLHEIMSQISSDIGMQFLVWASIFFLVG